MNKEKLKTVINIWKNSIKIENIDELEKDIQMSFEDLVFEMINGIYNEYELLVSDITVEADSYDKYIFSGLDGKYNLEDFLINRLLRNIQIIKYEDQSQKKSEQSEYIHDDSSIILDMNRLKNQVNDVKVRRKIVVHELLHGMKTQFMNESSFDFEEYYNMKEKIKEFYPGEVNDFSKDQMNVENDWNYSYWHCGLTYWSQIIRHDKYLSSFDSVNLDEIYTELDALNYSKDDKKVVKILKDGINIVLKNEESTNGIITNYAFFLEQLIDKNTKFIGLYLNPKYLFSYLNKLYSQTFQECYSSNKTFIEIFTEELDKIKNNPRNIDNHVKLQNALYRCLDVKFLFRGQNDFYREKNVRVFANNGLLEIKNNRLKPIDALEYSQEFESSRISKK